MTTTAGKLALTPAQRIRWWNRKSARLRTRLWTSALILVVGSAFMLIPFGWMVSTSVKEEVEVFKIPIQWIPTTLRWQNYPEAVTFLPYGRFFLNSTIISALVVAGSVASTAVVAYAFARLRAPGRGFWFILLLSTMMLPGEVTLVPTYLIFRAFRWLDTYQPLWVPYWFGGTPFFVFLLRQFFMTLPTELDDAARIDGANNVQIFYKILMPLSKPALATIAIFAFFGSWNAFQAPLIYLNTMEKYTVPLGLRFYLSTFANSHWNYLMAASLIAIVPPLILFFLAQRYFVKGAVLSGIKG